MTKIFGYKDLDDNVTTILAGVAGAAPMSSATGVLTEAGGSLTTDGNEQNLYINESPAGVFVPRILKINTTNHTAAETIVIREYYRTVSGGAYLEHDEVTYAGAITEDEITVHLDPNRFGIKVTIEKTAGNNKAYVWEVFYEV